MRRSPVKSYFQDDQLPVGSSVEMVLCFAITGGGIAVLWGAIELVCWIWKAVVG
jgi:hypothetical protein